MDGSVAQEEILSIARGILVLSPLEQGWGLENGIVFKGLKYEVLEGKDHILMIIINIHNNSQCVLTMF